MSNIDKKLENVTEKAEHLQEMVEQESFAMSMLREYSRNAKRWFYAWLVTFVVSSLIIGYGIWLWNQYDTISYSQDGNGYNNINTGEQGDVYNGTEAETKSQKVGQE